MVRLHHLGFVVTDISATAEAFSKSIGGVWNREVTLDPLQRVSVSFLQMPGTTVQMELVEPAGERSPVNAFLLKGGGLHHVCYEVQDCALAQAELRQRGGLVVSRPKPAVAFGGRNIAWVMTAEKLLVEVLETPSAE